MTSANATISDLLRMHSKPARAFAALYAATCVLLAAYNVDRVESVWPMFVSVVVCIAAAFVLVAVEGDPLPLGPALALMCTGAVSCGALFTVVPTEPTDRPVQLWTFGMSATVLVFMCVRGRTLLAWIGLILMFATSAVWAEATGAGVGSGLGVSLINAGPVLMGTVFAYTIRPLAGSIYRLRARTTQRIARESATAALLEERDAQLARLDALARPMLSLIASGEPLGDEDRTRCALLEARLRDMLRAPALQDVAVVEAAQAARLRGVEVVMLDDKGMDDVPAEVRCRVHRAVVDRLNAVASGAVTVRVLPPGRHALLTMLLRDHDEVRRIELDRDGAVLDKPLPATVSAFA
ncbi:hypothetical protein [Rhodococcus sp. (in: high G+C Gram-positive bacteria)]|uniref:hypothetical protein n=1 Tax=Rhodococcus sp. TaxID=1831 RepID=UPI00388F04D8